MLTPASRRGLRILACLAACAFEWLPLRLIEGAGTRGAWQAPAPAGGGDDDVPF